YLNVLLLQRQIRIDAGTAVDKAAEFRIASHTDHKQLLTGRRLRPRCPSHHFHVIADRSSTGPEFTCGAFAQYHHWRSTCEVVGIKIAPVQKRHPDGREVIRFDNVPRWGKV